MQFLIIKLNEQLYAINIEKVRSIEKNIKITPMSCVSKCIGMVTIRDEIIKIVDIFNTLNYEIKEEKYESNEIVIIKDNETFGLVIDDAINILEIEDGDILSVPDMLDEGVFSGIVKNNEQLIPILDIDKL